MYQGQTVFVVDDDEQARSSVCALARSMRVEAEAFASAEEFLQQYAEGRPGCVVADLRMSGMSGLELQERLLARGIALPFVLLTAYARTPVTVRAVQSGAVTVLDKPYADDDLWDAIRKALEKDSARRCRGDRTRELRARVARLTPGERQVMDLLGQGKPNKQIAAELEVSLRTVENRRGQVLAKMQAGSFAELLRLWMEAAPEGTQHGGDVPPTDL